MSEPSGFSDSEPGHNPRDHHLNLSPEDQAKLDAIAAELTAAEADRQTAEHRGDSAQD